MKVVSMMVYKFKPTVMIVFKVDKYQVKERCPTDITLGDIVMLCSNSLRQLVSFPLEKEQEKRKTCRFELKRKCLKYRLPLNKTFLETRETDHATKTANNQLFKPKSSIKALAG